MQAYQAFIDSISTLEQANSALTREKALAATFKNIGKLGSIPPAELSKKEPDATFNDKEILLSDFTTPSNEFVDSYGDWVTVIPQLAQSHKPKDRKKYKKSLVDLAHLAYLTSCITFENDIELMRRVQHAKTIAELNELEMGFTVHGKSIPPIAHRMAAACERNQKKDLENRLLARIDNEIKIRRHYLEQKNNADKVATVLTAIVSSLGVGLTAGIAMVLVMPLIWPAIPIAALIASVVLFTIFGSFTEFFVYRDYVKTFCRQCVRGFFESIDDRIYNREAKDKESPYFKHKHADKHDLTNKEKDELITADYQAILDRAARNKRSNYYVGRGANKQDLSKKDRYLLTRRAFLIKVERYLKRTFIVISGFLAIAAGVGFTGLIFSQLTSALTLFNIAAIGAVGAAALTAVPWALALVVGPLYAIVMYGMLYKAVKNNIFGKIWDSLKESFGYHFSKEQLAKGCDKFSKLNGWDQVGHIVKCLVKGICVAGVMFVSICATLFTAGAWIGSSVAFINTALTTFDLMIAYSALIARGAGNIIGGIFTAINLFFSLEKSLKSAEAVVKFVSNLKLKEVAAWFKHLVSSPTVFFTTIGKAFVNSIFLVMHILGTAAVASQGADEIGLSPLGTADENIHKLEAGLLEVGEEIAVDLDDVILHDINAHHHMHPKFSHQREYHKNHEHGHEHGNLFKFVKWAFFPAHKPKGEEKVTPLCPLPQHRVRAAM